MAADYYDEGGGRIRRVNFSKMFGVGDRVRVIHLPFREIMKRHWSSPVPIVIARRGATGTVIKVDDHSDVEYFRREKVDPYEYTVRFEKPIPQDDLDNAGTPNANPFLTYFFVEQLELLKKADFTEPRQNPVAQTPPPPHQDMDDMSDLIVELMEKTAAAKREGSRVIDSQVIFIRGTAAKTAYPIMELRDRPGIKKYLSRVKPVLEITDLDGEIFLFSYNDYRAHAFEGNRMVVLKMVGYQKLKNFITYRQTPPLPQTKAQ